MFVERNSQRGNNRAIFGNVASSHASAELVRDNLAHSKVFLETHYQDLLETGYGREEPTSDSNCA